MFSHPTPKPRRRPTPFTPRLEALETRCVPTASASGNVLTVSGNLITILDVGDNQASNTTAITVISDGVTQSFPGNIASINVKGNDGGDTVTYVLGGNLVANKLVTVAQRTLTANLSDQHNAFVLQLTTGQTFQGARYQFTVFGGAGQNFMRAAAENLIIDGASSLGINMIGGANKDNMAANIHATVQGALGVFLFGQGGADQVFENLNIDPSSTGPVVASVFGGGGNDLVGLILDLPPSTNAKQTMPTTTLDGGGGFNTGIHTANVIPMNIQSDLFF